MTLSALLKGLDAASVLQASGFRGDVTVFRLNARLRPKTGSESTFQRNTAEPVYRIETAHKPEFAGSNPAPATRKAPETGAFLVFGARHGRVLPPLLLPGDTELEAQSRSRTSSSTSPAFSLTSPKVS
jgi:hypothetical protein